MTSGLAGPPFPSGEVKGALVAVASLEKPSVPMVVGICGIDVAALQEVGRISFTYFSGTVMSLSAFKDDLTSLIKKRKPCLQTHHPGCRHIYLAWQSLIPAPL